MDSAKGTSKIEKTLQTPQLRELVSCLSDVIERAGFFVVTSISSVFATAYTLRRNFSASLKFPQHTL